VDTTGGVNRQTSRRRTLVGATGGDRVSGTVPSFGRIVADRRPALLPTALLLTALLLTGDRPTAEVLVQATLADSSRRWARLARGGDPGTAVLGMLATRAGRRRTRLLRDEQVIESAPAPGDAAAGTGFARVLRDLPPRTRAVVVLRRFEGLSAVTTAHLLDCPPATVDAEATRGLAVLRAALPAGCGPGRWRRRPAWPRSRCLSPGRSPTPRRPPRPQLRHPRRPPARPRPPRPRRPRSSWGPPALAGR
jgi:DNA-directed RNA polymerase specialized sigma24 family protein